MGKLVRITDNKAVEGIACHLRKRIVFRFLLAISVRFLRQKKLKIKLRREKIGKNLPNRAAEAGINDVSFKIGRDPDHQTVPADINRLAVGKPGRNGSGGQVLGQDVDDLVPNVVERVYGKHLQEKLVEKRTYFNHIIITRILSLGKEN